MVKTTDEQTTLLGLGTTRVTTERTPDTTSKPTSAIKGNIKSMIIDDHSG